MSRTARRYLGAATGFPRVSGDEPTGKDLSFVFAPFSPRERG